MAQRTDFSAMACSIARSWNVIGESWTPLILRDLIVGLRRFEQLREDIGISANILADRLKTLEEAGLVQREPYKEGQRTRHEYHLTQMGNELVPVLVALTNWGDRWMSDSKPPAVFHHTECGADNVTGVVVCSACGERVDHSNMTAQPGPGAHSGPGTRLIGAALKK